MIGQLRGTIAMKRPPQLILDVSGVGYELEAPMSTFYKLPSIGEAVQLFTHMMVREDAQRLFGFYEERERKLFRALLKVSGVGPRLALTILSGIEPDAFVQSVNLGDTATLVRLPGVGKKTAERLLIEMRDRLKDWGEVDQTAVLQAPVTGIPNLIQEAIDALIALGYKPQEATRSVRAVDTEVNSAEELIRLALQGALA